LDAGNYFWNSGMFLWQAKTLPVKIKHYAPDLYPFWEKMVASLKNDQASTLDAVFESIPSLSIDYALMEKAQPIWMCRGDFGWSDVGAWSSLLDIWEKDESGNALRGEGIFLDSTGCLVHNPGKITALAGVKNLIIVDTGDALLVCRRDCDQMVKQIVETIKKEKKSEYL
jgi:mannose-1-phosphate guanylyltransferase